MRAGAKHRERGFIAGNRTGKTETGAYETTLHLTGRYPDWWEGKRFYNPVNAWVGGDTNLSVRDILQAKLLGKISREDGDRPDEVIGLGTGMIPADAIRGTRPKAGVPYAIETAWIRHVSGGTSTLVFKSYEQGRKLWQGTERDLVWYDEEPPEEIYDEGLMRTMATGDFPGGIVLLTFTPLSGWSKVVERYMNEQQRVEGNRFVIQAGWDDAPHLSEAEKAEMAAKVPPHQRDARMKGIPQLGAGAIYPIPESDILVDPFEIPKHWTRGYGMDVGWNWTAVAFCAHDRDNDILYVDAEYMRSEGEPSVHAAEIKRRGASIPGVIDPAANGRSQVDGRQLITMYRGLGLQITPAQNAVEAGLYELWMRMTSGRFKVFKTNPAWLGEFRQYHRDEKGRIVKSNDHLMDSTRYRAMDTKGMKAAPAPLPARTSSSGGGAAGSWMA